MFLATLNQLIPIILPVIIAAAIGFVWARSGQRFETDFVTSIVTNVGTPCLVFHSVATADVGFDVMVSMGSAAFLVMAIMMVLGFIALKLAGWDYRSYLPPLMFANSGNMGLPICYFAFGNEGLALAIGFFAVSAFLQVTLGMALAAGSFSVRQAIQTPMIYAAVAALLVKANDWTLPLWLSNTTDLVGAFSIPLMVVTLGVSLARIRMSSVAKGATISLARLVCGTGLAYMIGSLLGLEGLPLGILVLQYSMPIAVFNYLFAQKYHRDAAGVASGVLISTVFSVFTLSIILSLLLQQQ